MLSRIKRSPALLAVIGVIVVAAIAFGWWTISPLFLKTTLVEGQNIPVTAAKPDDAIAQATKPGDAMAEAAKPGDPMVEAAKPGDPMAEAAKPDDALKADAPQGPVVLGAGNFDRKDDFHYASGQAIIARQEDGSHILRLQDLDAANGPDLYIYLTENPNPANSGELHQGEHNLGTLKATNGSFSYPLDPSIDVSKVKSVVIYCRAFSVIFSVATLQAGQ